MLYVATSNANFIPDTPAEMLDRDICALWWGMDHLNEVTRECDFDGIELTDMHAPHVAELQLRGSEHAQEVGALILSMHQGFRGVADPQPAGEMQDAPRLPFDNRDSLITKFGMAVTLPDGERSLSHLQRVERKLGRDDPMSYVIYPNIHGDAAKDRAKAERFHGKAGFQPTVDVVASWGIDPAKPGWTKQFADEIRARGLRVVWDEFHASRRGKVIDMKMDHEVLLEALLKEKLIDELHIGLFRSDFAKLDKERYVMSIAEGMALLNNDTLETTILGDTFATLRHYNWEGLVVIESTHGGMQHSLGKLSLEKAIKYRKETNRTTRKQLELVA